MSSRFDLHKDAEAALLYAVGASITRDTELDERHLICWGNLPSPPDGTWLGDDLMEALTEPVRDYYGAFHDGPVGRHIWRCSLGLHPDDGGLSDAQWSVVARHLLQVAGIAETGKEAPPVRWAALRDGGRGMHLVATLVREPDCDRLITPAPNKVVAAEWTRLTEMYFRPENAVSRELIAEIGRMRSPDGLADLLSEITREPSGPLSQLRRAAESAAHWSAARSEPAVQDAGHRLAWAARRLHSLQSNLTSISTDLRGTPTPTQPPPRAAAMAPPTQLKYMPPGRRR